MKLIEELGLTPTTIRLETPLAICNPSLIATEGGWEAVIRALDPIPYQHPAAPCLSSENWLVRFDDTLAVQGAVRLDDDAVRGAHSATRHGLEDGRLIAWRGARWILFSGFERRTSGQCNTMLLARIDGERLCDALILPSPRGQAREKNWMPWVRGADLYLVYSCAPLEVYRLEDRALHRVCGPERLQRALPLESGSSQLIPWGEEFLGVTHQRRPAPALSRLIRKYWLRDPEYRQRKVRFSHQFVLLDAQNVLKARSAPWMFETEGIEFCAGIARKGDRVVLSYGLMDREAKLVELNRAMIEPLLR